MKLHETTPRFYAGAWHNDESVADSFVLYYVGQVIVELFRRIVMWKW